MILKEHAKEESKMYKLVKADGSRVLSSDETTEIHFKTKKDAWDYIDDWSENEQKGWFIVPADYVYGQVMGGNGKSWTTPGQRG